MALGPRARPGNLGTHHPHRRRGRGFRIILVGENHGSLFARDRAGNHGSVSPCRCARAIRRFHPLAESGRVQVVATHLAGSVDYRTIDYKSKPVVLLMGK